MTVDTVSTTTPEGRDRVADVLAIADYILRGIFTWAMPADWGVDFGYQMGGWDIMLKPQRRGDSRSYSSAEEVLGALGITPENVPYPCERCGALVAAADTYAAEGDDGRGHKGCFGKVGDADSDWPPEPYANYARELWFEAGAVLRARGAPKAEPPKPARPPWADMRSADGALVLTIPDELIPFVGTEGAELAANEISTMTGMVLAYDNHRLSADAVRAAFDIRMALWRERKKVAAFRGGQS